MSLFDERENEMEDALLASLLVMHRREQARERERVNGNPYQRVVEHFEQRGERLRGERLMTAELVDRLLLGTEHLPRHRPLHRELVLRGPRAGVAAGRVRIRNESSETRTFELSVGDPVSGKGRPRVRLEPERGALAGGESVWVRISAELTDDSGDSVTLPVHCRWPTGYDRVWLVLEVERAEDIR